MYLFAFAAAGVIGVAVAIIVIFAAGGSSSGKPGRVGVTVPNLAKLPDVQTGKPPWQAEENGLKERSAILVIGVLHTHDTDGFIHVEAPQAYDYTLGQLFGVWGLRLSKTCIGGLCAASGKPLRVWVNGHLFKSDPTRLVLDDHQEIAIVYGTPPDKIPKSHDFSPVG